MAAMSFRPFGSLRGYRTEWLSGDAIAGLTVWAVLVPEALAYATIAGAPPVVGLYAAPGALILYAVVRQLAASHHRADVRHRGAVGRGRGAVRDGGTQRVRHADGGTRDHGGRHRPRSPA